MVPSTADGTATDPGNTPALDLRATSSLEAIIPALADNRVVLVGESHDRYDHHLNQLEIIRRLHQRHPDLAVGLEFFQQPYQAALDQYIAGQLDETGMLEQTEYYTRWGFDYRMYAPILRYAREQHIPLVALNLPQELTREVGRVGLKGLSEQQRAQIPTDMDRALPGYRERLRTIFHQHPMGPGRNFEHFLEVQLLWDEGMAERAAAYLQEHPGRHLVVLAGSGHVDRRYGIPPRLERRSGIQTAVVLNRDEGALEPGMGDFLLFPTTRSLPAAGRLGIVLEPVEGGINVGQISKNSAAEAAGLLKGDHLVSINGRKIAGLADVRLAMRDKSPGDRVGVQVLRKRWLATDEELSFEATLK